MRSSSGVVVCTGKVLLFLSAGLLLACFEGTAVAQERNARAMQLGSTPAELRMGFVGNGIARFQLLPIDAAGNVVESPDKPLLTPKAWRGEPTRVRELSERQVQMLGDARLSYDPSTWTVRLERINPAATAQPIVSIRIDPATGQITFPIDGPLFGLGEGGKQHDRRGATNRMAVGGWNDPDFPLNDWGEHLGIPWLVSPKGWGIYFHGPAGTFDLTGAEEGVFAASPAGGRRGRRAGPATDAVAQPIDCFLVLAAEPAGLMKAWAEISGYPSLPPIWSLGYIQSHREIESAEQILGVAKTLREKNLPSDMLIYLGTGFAPVGWNLDHGQFAFLNTAFPDPERQLREFEDLHFRVALHVTPRGENPPRRLSGRVTDEVPAEPYDPNLAAHYWLKHAPLMKQGVDAWWPDEGEGPLAAVRLARIQMYWEGPQQLFPDRRPYALHRTGAVGMQRYGGWLWSGDIKSKWSVLARHVPLGLNTSVSATPYWGTDTGGFYQYAARELDGELFTRWFQYSAFCPLFRSHGRDWQTKHLPYGYREDPGVENACRIALDTRYQLMPYTYSAVYEGHETGMPIMRPLWLHYPKDATAVALGDEYLWGRDLLIAPVVEKSQTVRKIYLPAGRWFNYWTNAAVEGGREIAQPVAFDHIPVYTRAGAIIPHGPKENYTEEKPNDPLEVRIYPGADGKFTLIEDDGVTFSSVPMRITFAWNDASKTLNVALAPGSQMRAPMTRRMEVKLVTADGSKAIEFRGEPIELKF